MLERFDSDHARAVLASKVEEDLEMIRRNFAIIPGEGEVVRVHRKAEIL